MLAIGSTLDGRYEILAHLAEGGMGAVYRARRVHLGDEVAIKVVQPAGDEPTVRERFMRESRIAAQLRHPNVVTILDFAIHPGGWPYLVMELLNGRSLRQELVADGPFDLERVQAIVPPLGMSAATMHLLSGATVLAALYLGGGLVASGRLSGETLALTALAIAAALESVFGLPPAYQFLSRTRAAGGRLVEIVECEPAVRFEDCSDGFLPVSCAVEFNGVSFRYGPDLPWALENVDLAVPAGRRLAVVGESGAGMSTLVNLLVRFFDPATGQIRIGGKDIRKLSEPDLRRTVVVVSQQSHLFSATVRENLLLAKPDADDRELQRALAAARLADVVARLPDGLDTWIGEAGRLLSAGQARRLAVARAVLRDAPVWVLDEPTEGLDRRIEAELVESLADATAGRTVLWITHRLIGMDRLGEVVVMENGRPVDRGAHADLHARNPRYACWCARMR